MVYFVFYKVLHGSTRVFKSIAIIFTFLVIFQSLFLVYFYFSLLVNLLFKWIGYQKDWEDWFDIDLSYDFLSSFISFAANIVLCVYFLYRSSQERAIDKIQVQILQLCSSSHKSSVHQLKSLIKDQESKIDINTKNEDSHWLKKDV